MPADDHTVLPSAREDDGVPVSEFRRPRSRGLDAFFGLLGTFMQVGSGLVMLPAVAASLAPAELTTWYVFLTMYTLALLVEFGFTPTFARNFTYVLSGARELREEGVPDSVEGSTVDLRLFSNLLSASRLLYTGMAAMIFVLLGIGGTVYLVALSRTAPPIDHMWPAWGVFITALAVQSMFSWQGCLMVGADRLRENYQVFTVARFLQVALSVGGLMVFPSILTLSIAYAVSVLVSVGYARLVIRDMLRHAGRRKPEPRAATALLRTLLPMASRLGYVTIGEFFTNRFALFAVSLAVGAAAAAEYALTMQVMMVILTVSQIGSTLAMPRIAAARVDRNTAVLRELYAFGAVLAVTMLACGSIAFAILGEMLLKFVGSETLLPPLPVLILLTVIYTLAVNSHVAMNLITTGNRVPHLRAVLLTGAATSIGVMAVALLKGDLFAFVAVQGVTQLAFNFWRWPLYAFRETGLTLSTLLPSALAGARRVLLERS